MAIGLSPVYVPLKSLTPNIIINPNYTISPKFPIRLKKLSIVNKLEKQSDPTTSQGDNDETFGVKVALSMIRFYRSEISPLLPKSCRYIPTCSEYSMIAYKKYGVTKGSILTVWRICRCNPLGGSGFDPPRWFDEPSPPED
ncbi:UPF0161 protein At3g09310 isoform X1 [Rutidosis leptorrhynchoides]|uniref:UPF0161 protein At3g09310 isoform X1 n=1 Tax=Rutidosis leptorrhynchoides TaxID=125765 RepID=UPI003A9A6025